MTRPAPFRKEASFYGVSGVESFSDLARVGPNHGLDPPQIPQLLTLRVMHCTQLSSLQGAGHFHSLTELNASSNNILSMAGLEKLTKLRTLTLSCNRI